MSKIPKLRFFLAINVDTMVESENYDKDYYGYYMIREVNSLHESSRYHGVGEKGPWIWFPRECGPVNYQMMVYEEGYILTPEFHLSYYYGSLGQKTEDALQTVNQYLLKTGWINDKVLDTPNDGYGALDPIIEIIQRQLSEENDTQ